MGKEKEEQFDEFRLRILLKINEKGIGENDFSEGENFIRLRGRDDLSLVIEKNPTKAGGSVEWVLQKDEEHIRRGSLSDDELKRLIEMWMQSILSHFGLEVKEDEDGFLYMEIGGQKYVFYVYSDGELISGYVIKKSNS